MTDGPRDIDLEGTGFGGGGGRCRLRTCAEAAFASMSTFDPVSTVGRRNG